MKRRRGNDVDDSYAEEEDTVTTTASSYKASDETLWVASVQRKTECCSLPRGKRRAEDAHVFTGTSFTSPPLVFESDKCCVRLPVIVEKAPTQGIGRIGVRASNLETVWLDQHGTLVVERYRQQHWHVCRRHSLGDSFAWSKPSRVSFYVRSEFDAATQMHMVTHLRVFVERETSCRGMRLFVLWPLSVRACQILNEAISEQGKQALQILNNSGEIINTTEAPLLSEVTPVVPTAPVQVLQVVECPQSTHELHILRPRVGAPNDNNEVLRRDITAHVLRVQWSRHLDWTRCRALFPRVFDEPSPKRRHQAEPSSTPSTHAMLAHPTYQTEALRRPARTLSVQSDRSVQRRIVPCLSAQFLSALPSFLAVLLAHNALDFDLDRCYARVNLLLSQWTQQTTPPVAVMDSRSAPLPPHLLRQRFDQHPAAVTTQDWQGLEETEARGVLESLNCDRARRWIRSRVDADSLSGHCVEACVDIPRGIVIGAALGTITAAVDELSPSSLQSLYVIDTPDANCTRLCLLPARAIATVANKEASMREEAHVTSEQVQRYLLPEGDTLPSRVPPCVSRTQLVSALAQSASDPASILDSICASACNAHFRRWRIFGVPVPFLVTTRDIAAGERVVAPRPMLVQQHLRNMGSWLARTLAQRCVASDQQQRDQQQHQQQGHGDASATNSLSQSQSQSPLPSQSPSQSVILSQDKLSTNSEAGQV